MTLGTTAVRASLNYRPLTSRRTRQVRTRHGFRQIQTDAVRETLKDCAIHTRIGIPPGPKSVPADAASDLHRQSRGCEPSCHPVLQSSRSCEQYPADFLETSLDSKRNRE